MTDQEIYDGMRNGDMRAWEAVFRKYHPQKHFNDTSIGKYRMKLGNHVLEEAWADGIEALFIMVQKQSFAPQSESSTFLLQGIRGITKFILNNLSKKKKTDASKYTGEEDGPVEPKFHFPLVSEDMLLLSICCESLEASQRIAVRLKYFPETPEIALMTDEELCALLPQFGFEKISRQQFGVNRRRGIAGMENLFRRLKKASIEAELKKLEKNDFNLLNLGFPHSQLWGILLNQGKRFPEEHRVSNALEYLDHAYTSSEFDAIERLRLYPSMVQTWMQRIGNNQNQGIIGRLSELIKAFGLQFLNKNNQR